MSQNMMFSDSSKPEEVKGGGRDDGGGKKQQQSLLQSVAGLPIRFTPASVTKTYGNSSGKSLRVTQFIMQPPGKKGVTPVSIGQQRIRTVQVPSSLSVSGPSSGMSPTLVTTGPGGLRVIRPPTSVRIVGTTTLPNRSLLSPVNAVVRSPGGKQMQPLLAPKTMQTFLSKMKINGAVVKNKQHYMTVKQGSWVPSSTRKIENNGQFIKLTPESGQPIKILGRDESGKNIVVVKRAGPGGTKYFASDVTGRQRVQIVDSWKNPRSLIATSHQSEMLKRARFNINPMPRPKEPEEMQEEQKSREESPSPPTFNGVEDYLFGASKKPRRPEAVTVLQPPEIEVTKKMVERMERIDRMIERKDVKVLKADEKKKEKVKEKVKRVEMCEEDKEAFACLDWDGSLGLLQGSDLAFKVNEFGVLELVECADDSERESSQESPRKKQKLCRRSDELVKCEFCGTYGMGSEFIGGRFCGKGCRDERDAVRKAHQLQLQDRANRKAKLRLRRQSFLQQRAMLDSYAAEQARMVIEQELQRVRMERELLKLDDVSLMQEEQGIKPTRSKYLNKVVCFAANPALFKDPFPTNRNIFKIGMKLEAIDPMHPSLICVCTIVEMQGYRLKLHFDGYPPCHDYWVNANSTEIFHPGWCERTDHKLTPPRGHEGPFNWTLYLESHNATAAPRHAFLHPQEKTLTPSGFRVGMKLEAVDKKNSRLVCVASIGDVIDNRILVHIDGWSDSFDYWADNTSPYIHPAGWCEENGHILHPPPDYNKNFAWDEYTAETKGFVAPARAFKIRAPHEFKKAMKIEAVDKRNPSLIRVATIIDTEAHQIRIKFDGWPEPYAYWVDDDSPEIHPIGWCARVGHPLTGPPTFSDLNPPAGQCPTPGCTGVGHAYNASPSHISEAACPYAPCNYLNDELIPERFSTTAEYQCAKKSSYSKGTKPRTLLSRRVRLLDHKKPSQKLKRIKVEPAASPSPPPQVTPPVKKKDEESAVLIKFKKEMGEKIAGLGMNPRAWTSEEVGHFIAEYLNEEKGKFFEEQDIDGEALLMLGQGDLIEHLAFKLGPAIKLYNCIQVLRQQALQCEAKEY